MNMLSRLKRAIITWLFLSHCWITVSLVHPGVISCHVTVRRVTSPGPQCCVIITLTIFRSTHRVVGCGKITVGITGASTRITYNVYC